MQLGALGGRLVVITALTCAVVSTGLALKHEFFRGETETFRTPKPLQVADWDSLASVGQRMGQANAPVTILEFGDFECPACRQFALNTLAPVRRSFPGQVSVLFRHWPLPYHKSAHGAAVAAECAAAQGRFEAMYDALYAQQDSLATKSMQSFAQEAEVPDSMAFMACLKSDDPIRAISKDSAAARRVGAKFTPTIIVNGKRYQNVPDSAALDAAIREALKKAKAR